MAVMLKRKSEPELKTYHAMVMVTRAEDWCVEAGSPDEARELLAPIYARFCEGFATADLVKARSLMTLLQ